MKNKRKFLKRFLWTIAIVFLLMNVIAIFHSYRLTHFVDSNVEKTKDARKLSTGEKIATLIFGVNNPRPTNTKLPSGEFEVVNLNSNKKIECWSIKTEGAKGTVIIFHGFAAAKSSMLDKAEVFKEQGYNTLLVDFMGSGGSEGNQTTIGFAEAEEVKTCYDY
ncbi:MAG TPA: alpha/beta hydrolase, partial [Bacteroidia bacterium]